MGNCSNSSNINCPVSIANSNCNYNYVSRSIIKGINSNFGDTCLLAPVNFFKVGKFNLYGMGLPVSGEHVNKLSSVNCGLLVSCLVEGLSAGINVNYSKTNQKSTEVAFTDANLISAFNNANISLLHIPIPDGYFPSIKQLDIFLEAANHCLNVQKKSVCVHCWQGKGRTGTLLSAYLIKYFNYSAMDAIGYVRKFSIDSVQSKTQEDFLINYEQYLKTNKNANNIILDYEIKYEKIPESSIESAINRAKKDSGIIFEAI